MYKYRLKLFSTENPFINFQYQEAPVLAQALLAEEIYDEQLVSTTNIKVVKLT
jgi:hypothetical protein